MKYITLFETAAAYDAATLDLPNVSLIEENMSVDYKPYVPETRLVCKYNVTDTSSSTALRTSYEQNIFKSMEIDDVMLDNLVSEYKFDTVGEHTVKYELSDETKVGNNAPVFNNSNLIECIIPDTVTIIGNNAFMGCNGLTSIVIPNNVISISQAAFNGCNGLASVIIGNGVTSIGENAFTNCSNLTSITVDSNNATYDSRNNCNAIIETATNTLIVGCKNTVIPDSIENISKAAFQGRGNLTSIVIPNSITSIGSYAFTNCTNLTNVTIGSGVTNIDSYAFQYCSSLTSIISNAMTAPTIQSDTFFGVNTGGTLTVPSGSAGYDVWMSTEDYYLGKYGWTKVEQ